MSTRARQAVRSSAPLPEWHSYRAELDVLEARLRVSHPDLDCWRDRGEFKHRADAVIAKTPPLAIRAWRIS